CARGGLLYYFDYW
nr:immunoglobulin heavy chain junction region [Mus musculus]MBK4184373.1 immunoglobulin heavy chain junction region [Mus musculus]